jgi:ABC-type lipoprotein export system ATPase subunit
MDTKIGKISKIEIKSLWNRFDLEWNLHPDVNILSGINGSGKSTILDCIAGLLKIGVLHKYTIPLVKSVIITFENGKYISYENIIDSIKHLELLAKSNAKYKNIISNIKEEKGDNYNKIKSVSFGISSFHDLKITPDELNQLIAIDIISTFDNIITEIGKIPDEHVRTELDRDIFSLQKKYLDYQLNIGKKAFEIVTQNNGSSQGEVLQIRKQQDRFLEIIDNLFKDTGKRINREKNEITFVYGDQELTAYQLSSGEKQMLVILLTVLVQDNKPSIIFMDEPEISLHFDWQKKLIQFIQELNPNVQIILATHSPAVIMEGWRNKVKDVRDLIVNDKANPTK